jgi:hypothetical protein
MRSSVTHPTPSPPLLRLLRFCLPTPQPHSINIHQTPPQIRRKHCRRQRDHTANQDIRVIRHHARGIAPTPPIIRRGHDPNVVDERVQDADFRFLGGEAVALYDGHELVRAGCDGGGGEEEREERGVVGKEGEEGGG